MARTLATWQHGADVAKTHRNVFHATDLAGNDDCWLVEPLPLDVCQRRLQHERPARIRLAGNLQAPATLSL